MFGLGLQELVFIFLIVFLLFGAKALPEIAKSLGTAMHIFKREVKGFKDELDPDQPKLLSDTTAEKDKSNDFDASVQKRDWRPKSETPA
ncbi:MAG: twin-arginine translocase TatA/TatE family subunit [Candidatus Omnitrophica bacterium]|nr:twin-arginine translocase TatA/TatE family subunit [Candidatus Omnitrophota bacterium]